MSKKKDRTIGMSAEARAARAPIPPYVQAQAKYDLVHKDLGKVRPLFHAAEEPSSERLKELATQSCKNKDNGTEEYKVRHFGVYEANDIREYIAITANQITLPKGHANPANARDWLVIYLAKFQKDANEGNVQAKSLLVEMAEGHFGKPEWAKQDNDPVAIKRIRDSDYSNVHAVALEKNYDTLYGMFNTIIGNRGRIEEICYGKLADGQQLIYLEIFNAYMRSWALRCSSENVHLFILDKNIKPNVKVNVVEIFLKYNPHVPQVVVEDIHSFMAKRSPQDKAMFPTTLLSICRNTASIFVKRGDEKTILKELFKLGFVGVPDGTHVALWDTPEEIDYLYIPPMFFL